MEINNLARIKKRIELMEDYLGIASSLEEQQLDSSDRNILDKYKKLIEINIKYEKEDLKIMQDELISSAQNATNQLNQTEKSLLQTMDSYAQETRTALDRLMQNMDDSLDEILHETFMNIESMKRRYA